MRLISGFANAIQECQGTSGTGTSAGGTNADDTSADATNADDTNANDTNAYRSEHLPDPRQGSRVQAAPGH